MPYFVFTVEKVGSIGRKSAAFVEQFDDFKEAKQFARLQRADLKVKDASQVKIMFAETQQEAKAKIEENREAPVLREWEK
jgi:hypothetical protein